jgi:hypothetical protein
MNTAQINARPAKAPMLRADLAAEPPCLDDDPEWNEFLSLGLAADLDDLASDTEWRRRPVLLSYADLRAL